jgi:hypothetical protein
MLYSLGIAQDAQQADIAANVQPTMQQFVNVLVPALPQGTSALLPSAVPPAQNLHHTYTHTQVAPPVSAQVAVTALIPHKDVLLPQPLSMAAPLIMPRHQVVCYQVPAGHYGGVYAEGVQVQPVPAGNHAITTSQAEEDVDVGELLALLQV